MSELHKFLFEGLPVRGVAVRLTDSWREVLKHHEGDSAYSPAVRALLGEMAAASLLMQSNIKFNGALILQIQGDGPVKLAVAEAQPNLNFRCTATVQGEVAASASLADMVNEHHRGKCVITLDPKDRLPGQQPYQGVVPLHGDHREKLSKISEVLEHYMLQSEQLDTKIVLAANDEVAAGILVQRLPTEGNKNLDAHSSPNEEGIGVIEEFNRIAILTSSITPEELLSLPTMEVLHRLFWEQDLLRHHPETPSFACSCSRERVANMIRNLGIEEVQSILSEQPDVSVGCEFCGQHYRFDPLEAARLFKPTLDLPPASSTLQ